MKFDTQRDLQEFLRQERRAEIRYGLIVAITMAACFILGLLIGGVR